MTRFFMGIDEAVNLVLKTAMILEGGETFIRKNFDRNFFKGV